MAGLHHPAATGEFMAWFSTDADCLDYLEWLRWPSGFVCPECGQGGWRLGDGRFECSGCGRRTSVTAGTIFDRTRTPLTVWFTACWQFAAAKDGISALSLQRSLEIGSHQTAWAVLHRLRSVLVRPGRERLTGVVEVDETYLGGEEPGLRGGRAKGKKLLVGIAVERRQPRGLGRCRMAMLPDAQTDTLRLFLADHVEEGATVITDGWQPYRQATAGRYVHQRRPVAGREANTTLPGRAPGRLAGQAVAARHPPGLGGRRPPARLPRRVRLPLQPPPLTQSWARLLPRPGARRRSSAGALSRPRAQLPDLHGPTTATRHARQAADAGPPAGTATMADR